MEKTLCRYFLHGACSRGSQCKYAHDLNAKPDNVCKFYQSGCCMYGKSCRYDHVKVSKPSTTATVKAPVIDIDTLRDTKRPLQTSSKVLLGKKSIPKKPDEEDAKPLQWTQALEFVPGRKAHGAGMVVVKEDEDSSGLYSNIVSPEAAGGGSGEYSTGGGDYQEECESEFVGECGELLCPFAQVRDCPYGDECTYLHGDLCDMCGCMCLHPTDTEQRKEHERECMEHHEREMELAFAAQRSSGMSCSICLDVVIEKADITERQFGILENCNHAFCLGCIRKWRVSNNEKTVVRACPICRVVSWFVTPSEFWIEDPEEKNKLINSYKEHLQTKHCRNFDRGKGVCQFGSSCFYKHVLEDGTVEETTKPDLRHTEDSEGTSSVLRTPMLSEFIAARDA